MQNMIGSKTTMDKGMLQHADISSEEEFIRHMIPHHQEAVDTASRLSQITQNETLKKLTTNIVVGQQQEIDMMQQWLQNRYATGTVQVAYQPMMRDTTTLSAIESIEHIWLEDMIEHHMGAVMMAKEVLQLSPRPEVLVFANNVIDAQSQEITQMKKMLRDDKKL